MATADPDALAQVRKLMREGKVQEADDLLSKHMAATPQAQAAAAAAAAEPAPPRDYDTVLHELLTAVVDKLGNHPALEKLLEELKAIVTVD
jgi:hypothetical protein